MGALLVQKKQGIVQELKGKNTSDREKGSTQKRGLGILFFGVQEHDREV